MRPRAVRRYSSACQAEVVEAAVIAVEDANDIRVVRRENHEARLAELLFDGVACLQPRLEILEIHAADLVLRLRDDLSTLALH